MSIGIIGCGLIGEKRALSAKESIKYFFDNDRSKSGRLAKKFNAKAANKSEEIFLDSEINSVIIATPHLYLKDYFSEARKHNKNILIEKPGCISLDEARFIYNASKTYKKKIQIGFNHRFHPSILKIKDDLKNKMQGKLLFIRAVYGHGGRLHYEKEWRADKATSGGGELIDQGSHLIDLALFFNNKLKLKHSIIDTLFWNMNVEDNAFITLKDKNAYAFLSASWTEWKNTFSFELMFENVKYHVSGLGGSYGKEKLKIFRMKKEMGIPDEEHYDFPHDSSWDLETKEFLSEVPSKLGCSPKELLSIWQIINQAYKNDNC